MRITTRSKAGTIAYLLAICPALFLGCAQPTSDTTSKAPAPSAVTASVATAGEVRHVDAKGALQLLNEKKDVVVLDVRTPAEFASGHIAGATNLDFNAAGFADGLAKLDRSKTYLVHCAAGGRSTRSLARFQELGFKSVVHMDGGFNGWTQAGQPVAK